MNVFFTNSRQERKHMIILSCLSWSCGQAPNLQLNLINFLGAEAALVMNRQKSMDLSKHHHLSRKTIPTFNNSKNDDDDDDDNN